MNHLVSTINASANTIVEVTLTSQANVLLMSPSNYHSYRSGRRCTYHGGLAKVSPCRIAVPHAGTWHVVVDLGGYSGHVSASVRTIG
jgi:hypothetical protein